MKLFVVLLAVRKWSNGLGDQKIKQINSAFKLLNRTQKNCCEFYNYDLEY